MQKNNAGSETAAEQQARSIKRARRERRKHRRAIMVDAAIRPLLVKVGSMQARIKDLENQLNQLQAPGGSKLFNDLMESAEDMSQGVAK